MMKKKKIVKKKLIIQKNKIACRSLMLQIFNNKTTIKLIIKVMMKLIIKTLKIKKKLKKKTKFQMQKLNIKKNTQLNPIQKELYLQVNMDIYIQNTKQMYIGGNLLKFTKE